MPRFRTYLAALAVAAVASPATAITYDVFFTADAGVAPTGTITFTGEPNDGVAAATSFSFTDGISTWETNDSVASSNGTFSGGNLVALDVDVTDTASPGSSGDNLFLDTDGTWSSAEPSGGTYTVSAVPEPGTAALVAAGALALGLRRLQTLHR